MTGWRGGWRLITGTCVAAGALLLVGANTAQAGDIDVVGSTNCDGPDTWVATWVVSVTADAPDETWRLDSSAGVGEVRPVSEPVVLDQVQTMDQPMAHLDAVATIMESGSTASVAATVERPAACMSAPAPPATVATPPDLTSAGIDESHVDDSHVDEYSCPGGSDDDDKVEPLSGGTFTVPSPPAGSTITGVVLQVGGGGTMPASTSRSHRSPRANCSRSPVTTTSVTPTSARRRNHRRRGTLRPLRRWTRSRARTTSPRRPSPRGIDRPGFRATRRTRSGHRCSGSFLPTGRRRPRCRRRRARRPPPSRRHRPSGRSR